MSSISPNPVSDMMRKKEKQQAVDAAAVVVVQLIRCRFVRWMNLTDGCGRAAAAVHFTSTHFSDERKEARAKIRDQSEGNKHCNCL